MNGQYLVSCNHDEDGWAGMEKINATLNTLVTIMRQNGIVVEIKEQFEGEEEQE